MGKGYPQDEDNKAINEFLGVLDSKQKEVLAKMIQDARIDGMHDTLAYMNKIMDCEALVISHEGKIYQYDHFESMHYDFICRCEGFYDDESLNKR